MEKRGLILRHDAGVSLQWQDRPGGERPFRVVIRPDYCDYAWNEYGAPWMLTDEFAGNPIAEQLDKDFSEWLHIFLSADIDDHGHPIINFSWEEFHHTGLRLAKRLKMLGGKDIIVYYEKPFEDTFLLEEIQIVETNEFD